MPWTLLAALVGLGGIAWLVNTFSPDSWFVLVIFLTLVAADVFLFVLFLSKRRRLSVLASLGATAFLLLRLLELHSPLYLALLVIMLISLELTWKKR